MNILGYPWPVTLRPRVRRLGWMLAAPLLPFVALEAAARRLTHRRPYPWWVQLSLAGPAFVCLALPTKLYEELGLLTVLDLEEPNHAVSPS